MSLARYLSKLGALLNSSGQVGTTGLQDSAVTDAKVSAVGAGKLTGSRTTPKGVMPTGSVLQVVHATTFSTLSTNSASDVATGFSASITPTSSTSKVLILLAGGGVDYGGGGSGNALQGSIYRGATKLANLVGGTYSSTYGYVVAGSYYDSPASTSSLTYQVYISSSGGITGYLVNGGSSVSRPLTLTLIEVAA